MRSENIYKLLTENLGHIPTDDQSAAMKELAEYITLDSNDVIFMVTGYAGTGKTSLINALTTTLGLLRIKSVLMAPTGRAAKVLASYTGKQSFTVHKKIYRQKSAKDGIGRFVLDRNLSRDTFFIVDEASMISDNQGDSSIFGSGHLLDDLIEYVYSGIDCKLIIVGDNAQLPPVGLAVSPALDSGTLGSYGFGLRTASLRDVVRQSESSGILVNATMVRRAIEDGKTEVPVFNLTGFKDIIRLNGEELLEELNDAYSSAGTEGTIIITSSNARANSYNKGLRARIFFREEEISAGDLVMVVKNNYFWLSEEEGNGFIANGDTAEVKRIRNNEERYGFRFADMTLYFPDYDIEREVKVILDTLDSDTPSMSSESNKELYFKVLEDYPDLRSKRKQQEAVKSDPFFNALQIKFAYAVTCHKAQGGQWERVFVEQGILGREQLSIENLRWLYTAITRATTRLYLVNFGKRWFPEED